MEEQGSSCNPSQGAEPRAGWVPDADWFNRAHKALMVDFGDEPSLKRNMVAWLFEAGFYDRKRTTFAAGMRRFNDCLNPARIQKFSVTELFALAQRFRRVAFLSLMMDELAGDVHNIVGLLQDVVALQTHNAERLAQLMAGTGYAPPADPRMHPQLREGAAAVYLSAGDRT